MHHKILTITLAVFGLALAASPALAAKAPHRYSPKPGVKCRKHYKRVKHGHRVYCVRRATKKPTPVPPTIPAPTIEKVELHAHLDPTYTRNPLNPFQVTYAYSASASQQTFSAESVPLGTEAAAPLPSGVLSFYSDGKLECAINVGSGVEGSECPVTYQALGEHRVTTIYASGEQSATATESEDIGPLATETTLSINYTPVPVKEGEEVEPSTGLYHIGDLMITVGASPSSVTAHLGCGEGTIEHLTPSGCYQVESSVEHVYGQSTGSCLGGIYISKETAWAHIAGESLTSASLENGTYDLRAGTPARAGYSGSEARTPLRFTPGVAFEPNC